MSAKILAPTTDVDEAGKNSAGNENNSTDDDKSASIIATMSGNSNGNNNNNREFVEGWTLAQTLGEGAYGEIIKKESNQVVKPESRKKDTEIVKLLINRQTGEAVAMKMVDLKKHSDAVLSVRKEICIQRMLQDQHILRFYGNRSSGHIEYIFLEYAAGGELFDRIGK
uniref:Protein kinase domain-containing protein n=1 Tax=Glossina palpalis gambiensis TaxID=67801 RepID=A0A1B0BV75_9MUSC